MASWDDVHNAATALPGVEERLTRRLLQWRVRDKPFAWERPLRPKDVEALGEDAWEGEVLAVRTDGVAAKEAMLAAAPEVYFTTPHFDGYPAVLIRLERVNREKLDEILAEAWLVQAPRRLANEFLGEQP